jgi:hypothetical protein
MTFGFALADVVFTPNMAVRTGQAAFDAAPIVQGKWDGTGTPDLLSFPRGALLGNQTQFFYSNLDPYQGSISFWITPEWDGDDGIEHNFHYTSANYRLYKSVGNALVAVVGGQTFTGPSTAAWTAGTTYHVVFSYDIKNAIDGTNYARWSVNDAHTYGVTTQPTASVPDAEMYIGSTNTPTLAADAGIEGFVITRVVWYDGTYGCPMWFDETGPIDVINAIWAAGAGADPAIIFGSWDTTFFLPTDQTEGPFQTTGQAWSHPHGSELIDVPFVDDGGLPGTDYVVEFDGSTYINCGSGATLDDIPSGAEITIGAWVRLDMDATNQLVVMKGSVATSGWSLYYAEGSNSWTFRVELDTTNVVAFWNTDVVVADGKLHHIAAYYNDATKQGRIAHDGRWDIVSVGVGAYTSDAATDVFIGRRSNTAWPLYGAIAWLEVWDNDHLGAGTDFIPPRAPTAAGPGNLIETWWADEGTGATAAAQVTSPANDGTISNGSWSAIWAIVGTPEIPQSLEFFQENDGIDFGSGANIDDLPSADCTIEFWARIPSDMVNYKALISKGSGGVPDGWWVETLPAALRVHVYFDNTNISADYTWPRGRPDNIWRHYALDWDVGTLTLRFFVCGEVQGTDTAVGNYVVDAGRDMLANGITALGSGDGAFAIGSIRLSDNRRYTGNSFIPPSRNNWPANDANAQLITRMNDGAGATVTDYSGNAYHGTVTFGATTRWNNTPDLAIDEPGAMIYQQGYNVGSDGANDGIYIPHTLAAATDYVIRVPMCYSPNAWPRITLWDVVGAGAIVDFDAPPMTAVHDGAGGAATFTSTGEVYPASLIGSTIYNVDDGSSGTITAVGGTNQDTITAALAGGGSNDWQVGEQAYIITYDGWVFNEPIVVRTSANTAYELRITNRNSDGVITVHQAGVLLSLLANGDHESLNGGFPGAAELITGWTNAGLDAGDTEPEVYTMGAWVYGDGTAALAIGANAAARGLVHSSEATVYTLGANNSISWKLVTGVWRDVLAGMRPTILNAGAPVGDRYSDDVYMFELDSITLTVTPASQANSLELDGLRVDGYDTCTQVMVCGAVAATFGQVRWTWTPRHNGPDVADFGHATPYIAAFIGAAANYIHVYFSAANVIRLAINTGGGESGDTWNPAAGYFVPGTEYEFEVWWNASQIRLLVDRVERI